MSATLAPPMKEFLLSKREYEHITGRHQQHDVIAYQIRQFFKPGEITPEEANQIGYELAMRWTKGKHAFIVATHTDRAHIHKHIIYTSTTLDCTRKFKDFHLPGLHCIRGVVYSEINSADLNHNLDGTRFRSRILHCAYKATEPEA